MTYFLINILATSNLAQVLAEDDAALQINTDLLAENTAALKANAAASKNVKKPLKEVATATKQVTIETEQSSTGIKNFIRQLLGLDDASRKVGYNVLGFSFRVGNWFVPAMLLLASSLLPVIAGLLAIGSAAAIATLGILGLLAVGAIVLSRRNASGNTSGGIGGFRRPYSGLGGTGPTNVMTTIFQPIVDILDSKQFRRQTDSAVIFFKATMGALGAAIGNFMTSANSPAFGIIKDLFLNWLPAAGTSLAKWGSRILGLIGVGSLSRINKFFIYLANGIENTSRWLAQGGGWQNIDMLLGIIGDIISVIMTLGKSAFPIFLAALNLVYPNPLRPLLLAASTFFKDLSENKDSVILLTNFIKWLVILLIAFEALRIAIVVIFALCSEYVLILLALVVALVAIYVVATQGVTVLVSIIKYLMLSLVDWLSEKVNTFLNWIGKSGTFRTNRSEGMTWDNAVSGAYAPATWYNNMQKDNDRFNTFMNGLSGITGAGTHAVDVFFHPDDAWIDSLMKKEADNKTGSNTTVDSNLKARRMISL